LHIVSWQVSPSGVTTEIYRQTKYHPDEGKTCEGFCNVDVLFAPDPGSPKFHDQDEIAAPEGTID
jgi:hypothetical protein